MLRTLRTALLAILGLTCHLAWASSASGQVNVSNSPAIIQKLNQAGVPASEQQFSALYRQGKYAEALPHAARTVALRTQIQGAKHSDVATAHINLALVQRGLHQFEAADKSYASGLVLLRELFGDKHLRVAHALRERAMLYQDLGQHAAARKGLEEAAAIRREQQGAKHAETLQTVADLAYNIGETGERAAARDLYLEVLAARREALGDNHLLVAQTYNDLGVLLHSMGDLPNARACYEKTAGIYRTNKDASQTDLANTWCNLAHIAHETGDDLAARDYVQASIEINKAVYGDQHPEVADDYVQLGGIQESLGDRLFAWKCYTYAHGVYYRVLGPKHPKVASTLSSMTDIALWYGNLTEARKYADKAAEIYRELEGPETTQGLANLAAVLRAQGEFAEARKIFERLRDARLKTLGPEHTLTLDAIGNLGGVYDMERNYAAAIPLFQQVAAAYRKKFGPAYESSLIYQNNLAGVLACGGEWSSAVEQYDELRRLVRQRMDVVLSNLGETEQLGYLKGNYQRTFHAALSLALSPHREQPRIREVTANWAINGKGVSLDALAKQQRMNHPDTPERRVLYAQLRDVRRRLLSQPAARTDAERAELDRAQKELEQEERKLSREVATQLGLPVVDDPWVELAAIRKALPADGVLIEIISVEIFRFDAGPKESRWALQRLVAWVVPPEGEIQVVDLGPTHETVEKVRALQLEIQQSAQQILDEGEADAEKILREKLEAVAAKVLHPLEAVAGKYQQWYIGNDTTTWLIPWAALPTKEGKYLVEDRTLQLVISGRDLVAPAGAATTGGLIVADPDFSLDLSKATPAGQLAGGQQQARRSRDMQSKDWARLPFTLTEAKAALPILTSYLKQAPQLVTGAAATETVIKQAQRPRVALFSTHGFFLNYEDATKGATDAAPAAPANAPAAAATQQAQAPKPPENPLLRCGLVLAGANRPPQAQGLADDGVLTGLEIVELDFRGTELVVLSACETGLGDARYGEGVAGLRQAFQLAGAQSVLATLWQVPDAETSNLITTFWQGVAQGQSRAAALRAAQLAVIARHRAADQAAHPYFWAAFTLTGRP